METVGFTSIHLESAENHALFLVVDF